MKAYVLSLLAGILVGVVYSLIGVPSPAPPIVALVGLLGILAGEQIFPVAKKMLSRSQLSCGLEGGALQPTSLWVFAWPELGKTWTHGGSIV